MTESTLLTLRGISKQHRENDVVTHALEDVSLTVRRGEFISIVGPSGAGKSTLLNILGLLESASSGTYELNGIDVSRLKERQRDALRARTFGFVFQSSHALPEETVARNAALALDTQNLPRVRQSQIIEGILRDLGLLHTANRRAKYLSGGERQRLALGRAISTDPLIVLADEPTGNLDRENSARVLALLRGLNDSGVTVILITHDEQVAGIARRRIRIVDGNIVNDDDIPAPAAAVSPSVKKEMTRGRPSGTFPRVLSDALASITSHAARSAFLILAFLLGAGGLVSAVGLSESAATQVATRLNEEALDRVSIHVPDNWSADQRALARGQIESLTGVQAVAEKISISSSEAAVTLLPPNSFRDQPTFGGLVAGADTNLLTLEGIDVLPAQAARVLDGEEPVALIGESAAAELGVESVGPGIQLWIDGSRVPVGGIISGNDQYSRTILLPLAYSVGTLGGDRAILIKTTDGYPAPIADALPLMLAPAQPASIAVETVADLRNLTRGVNADFAVFVAAMSIAILVLASFSAATTMYLSVMGRSTEIALRRALGASRRRISLMFLGEGALLGIAGGGAGCAIGSLVVVAFCAAKGWSAELSAGTIGLALGVGLATGLLSAIVPAARAARIDPAQAIRA